MHATSLLQTAIPGTHWYALRTDFQREVLARASLTGLLSSVREILPAPEDQLVWFPEKRGLESRSVRRIQIPVTRPLVPGYIFVRLTEFMHETLYRRIATSRGVAGFLRLGGCDAIVRDEDALQRLDECGSPASADCIDSPLRPGDAACVTSGPFMGRDGVVHRLDAAAYVVLLMNCLGPASPVKVPRAQVARV